MKTTNLEDTVKSIDTPIVSYSRCYSIKEAVNYGVNNAIKAYTAMHSKCPLVVNYVASAIGIVGGDIVGKQFSENPNVTLRDIVFTASAAALYSYIAPRLVDLSKKAVKYVKNKYDILKTKNKNLIFNAEVLAAMYFPVDLMYWNYLSIKNHEAITLQDNLVGVATLGLLSVPYIFADYFAIKKLSTKKTKKFLQPFYSAIDLALESVFAISRYASKAL